MRDRFDSPEYAGTNRTCEARGCHAATRHNKPFCPAHVDHHGYPQQIIATLEARARDLDRAENNKLKAQSQLVREAVHRLAGGGTVTIERLRRDLNLTDDQVKGLCWCLFRNKLAKEGRSNRGKVTVTLRARLQEAR